jgi:hypothetical protein
MLNEARDPVTQWKAQNDHHYYYYYFFEPQLLFQRFSNCNQAYKTNKTKIRFLSHKLRANCARESQIELQYLIMPRK